MVAEVRAGASMRSVARLHHVSLFTVQWWMRRAGELSLEQVNWSNRPPIPARDGRTAAAVEDLVLTVRRELKEHSALGEYGAKAIHAQLVARRFAAVPSLRTIGRILERRGALDAKRRIRRNPPPVGWYLADVAANRAELDSFDVVEGLALEGGVRVEVLNAISVRGGLPAAWPQRLVTAKSVVTAALEHWREFGLPAYAQFDNDTIFQGSHHGHDSLGRVTRICLLLGVTPVFAPPREPGFQAAIENFNGRWQAKVWSRFHHRSLAALQAQSRHYIRAYRQRAAARIAEAPPRRRFPRIWQPDLQAHPQGVVIFIRRTCELGTVSLLGHSFKVAPSWPHRLVRCEIDLTNEAIRFYALRRRDPAHQPLLRATPYQFPRRPFHD